MRVLLVLHLVACTLGSAPVAWTKDEVARWVGGLAAHDNFRAYSESFRERGVTGRALLSFNQDTLAELVASRVDQQVMLAGINRLRKHIPAQGVMRKALSVPPTSSAEGHCVWSSLQSAETKLMTALHELRAEVHKCAAEASRPASTKKTPGKPIGTTGRYFRGCYQDCGSTSDGNLRLQRVCGENEKVGRFKTVAQCVAACKGHRFMSLECPTWGGVECRCCDKLRTNVCGNLPILNSTECFGGPVPGVVPRRISENGCTGFGSHGYKLGPFGLGGSCRAAIYEKRTVDV